MRRVPRPIVNCEERVIGMLGGQPRDPGWEDLGAEAAREMEEARQQLEGASSVKGAKRNHRRGEFLAGAVGASYGGGRTVSLHFSTLKLESNPRSDCRKCGQLRHDDACDAQSTQLPKHSTHGRFCSV